MPFSFAFVSQIGASAYHVQPITLKSAMVSTRNTGLRRLYASSSPSARSKIILCMMTFAQDSS